MVQINFKFIAAFSALGSKSLKRITVNTRRLVITKTSRFKNMSYNFKGKWAVVTGGSRGIGKEVIRQLLSFGAKVYAIAKTRENLDKLKEELPSVETICVDLANWDEARRSVESIKQIDFLVNNAAILSSGMFQDVTEEDIDRNYAVNLKPIINLSQVVTMKLKIHGKPGSIVNVSSNMSTECFPAETVYGSGKAAVDRITRQMAIELAPLGIRVNSVNPTAVETDMMKDIPKEIMEKFVKTIPLGQICTVKDIANAILFLLSDNARMITGVNLFIDGGQSCSTPFLS